MLRNRRFGALMMMVVVVTALLVASCSSSKKKSNDTTPSSSSPTSTAQSGSQGGGASGPVKVDIKNFAFKPQTVKVKVGQSVDFVNGDDTTHTATAKDKTFDTGDLAKGASKSVTFSKPGTFQYICSIHNYMTGTVTVTG